MVDGLSCDPDPTRFVLHSFDRVFHLYVRGEIAHLDHGKGHVEIPVSSVSVSRRVVRVSGQRGKLRVSIEGDNDWAMAPGDLRFGSTTALASGPAMAVLVGVATMVRLPRLMRHRRECKAELGRLRTALAS